ncbi:MAG: RHS repeat-associated core domain-containing protein [Flavobacteriaceae bacterium]|nr:RHS repeat-associated core domain-containing protein [Flavobacteriaceae bacterium]
MANINQTVTTKTNEYRDYQYSYDKNGNMIGYAWGNQYRDMLWDEENRLQAVNDEGYISMYTYDDSGERVIKSSGGTESMFVNGANIGSFGHEKNYTGYLSPYFVFKEGSFTKHYYIGAQRIVSKIGNGRFDNNSGLNGNGITAGGINFAKQQSWYDKKVEEYIASLGIPPGPPDKKGIYGSPEYTGQPYPDFGSPLNESNEPPLGWPKVPVFNQPGDVPGPPIKWGDPVTNDNVEAGWGYEGTGVIEETDLYFYHPDHLGSTSYVTTRLGKVSQHVEYIPFGEVFLEEKNDKWNTPYKFNAKEMDEETGLYYYGARYYDSKISVWYSVDKPLIDGTYLSGQHDGGVYNSYNLNSYSYCRQNPVLYVDPDGNQYVFMLHMDGGTTVVNYYKMSKAEIKKVGGTYQGAYGGYNAASYGPEGRGVKHTYIYGGYTETYWDFESDYTRHGLYSGSGSITDGFGHDHFGFQPIDIADAIAKRHDMDYAEATASGNYLGFAEDTRTLQADIDMVYRVDLALNGQDVSGVETPFRGGSSGEMRVALKGQQKVIGALRDYKQWKVDNNIQGTINDTNVYDAYQRHAGRLKAYFLRKIAGNSSTVQVQLENATKGKKNSW